MSMANLIVQRDRAYLMTDSGYFRTDGTISMLGPKSMVLERLSLALAMTGALHLGWLADEIARSEFEDVTSFLRQLGPITQRAYARAKLSPDDQWSRVVVAFYARDAGRAYGCTMFSSAHAGPGNLAPWGIYPANKVVMPSVDERAVFPAGITMTDPACFDPAQDAGLLIDAQRGALDGWESLGRGCFVAGDIDLTIVSAGGVTVQTLRSFSDAVGLKAGEGRNSGFN